MKAIEREILRHLYDAAAAKGFVCVRFACTPATGEAGDEISDPTYAACLDHAHAWDTDSIIEFSDGKHEFWVLLVWGNGEGVISDYLDTPAANAVCDEVAAWIDPSAYGHTERTRGET